MRFKLLQCQARLDRGQALLLDLRQLRVVVVVMMVLLQGQKFLHLNRRLLLLLQSPYLLQLELLSLLRLRVKLEQQNLNNMSRNKEKRIFVSMYMNQP